MGILVGLANEDRSETGMTTEFHPAPNWLSGEAEQLRLRIAEMLAERQRAAALNAIHVEDARWLS